MKIDSTEHQEQVALFRWIGLNLKKHPQLRYAFAIPNGGKRDMGTAMKLKREGVKKGVPDIFLPVIKLYPFCGGLWIELKRPLPRGKVSREQHDWILYLKNEGYRAEACWGWEEARDLMIKYLEE